MMTERLSRTLFLVPLLFGTVPVAAHDPAKEAPALQQEWIQGRALRADGAPWSDARVLCLGVLHANAEIPGRLQRLEVKSDERGRFRLRVPRSHRWVLWATQPGEAGLSSFSVPLSACSGQTGLELQQSAAEQPSERTLRLPPAFGGVAVEGAVVELHGVPIPASEIAEGRAHFAGIPLQGAHDLHLLAGKGRALAWTRVAWSDATKEATWPEWPGDHVLLRLHCDGEPVAGVDVFEHQSVRRRYLGTTNEKGLVVAPVLVPSTQAGKRQQAASLRILVQAQEHVSGTSFLYFRFVPPAEAEKKAEENEAKKQRRAVRPLPQGGGGAAPRAVLVGGGPSREVPLGRDPEELLRAGVPDVELELAPAARLRGRLMLGPDRPAAHTSILACTSIGSLRTKNQVVMYSSGDRNERRFVTDADGHFEISGLRPRGDLSLRACLDEAQMAALSETCGQEVAAVAWFRVGAVPAKPGAHDLGAVRLDQLARILVAVRSRSGTPARWSAFDFSAKSGHGVEQIRGRGAEHALSDFLDRRGRCVLLYPSATKFEFACVRDASYVTASDETPDRAGAEHELDLLLEEALRIEGRVLDVEGNPVAGAQVRRTRLQGTKNHLLFRAMPQLVFTDAEGRFSIPVLPNGRYHLLARLERLDEKGQKRVLGYFNQLVPVQDIAPDPVELKLRKPPNLQGMRRRK